MKLRMSPVHVMHTMKLEFPEQTEIRCNSYPRVNLIPPFMLTYDLNWIYVFIYPWTLIRNFPYKGYFIFCR